MPRVHRLWRRLLESTLLAAILFTLSLGFFLERGPYRALRDVRSHDFATIYAASRCWLQRENPYARTDLMVEFRRAGAPAALISEQEGRVSAYPVSAMPFGAVFGWLPWRTANVAYCLFSVGCFAASLIMLLQTFASLRGKLAAATCCLFFSPAYVGVLNGNPSVIAISLTIISLSLALKNWPRMSGVLFAITLCIKLPVALCSLLAFFLWKRWMPLLSGLAGAVIITSFATLWVSSFGQNWQWWESVKQNSASLVLPGGLDDPRPSSPYADGFLNAQTLSYLLTSNAALAEGLVFVLTAAMLAFYGYRRYRGSPGDSRIDAAFIAAITLEVAYHRYYDGQLLLLLIPAVAYLWRIRRVRTASALGVCFALVAFPLQSVFSRQIDPAAVPLSIVQILLFRHQPAAVLAIAMILSFAPRAGRETSMLERHDDPKPIHCGRRLHLP